MILGYKKGMGSFMKKLFCLFISVLGLFLLANCSKKEYDLKYLCEHRTEEVEIAYKQLIKWEGFECEKILFYKRSEMLESDYNKLRDYFSFNFEEILVSKTTINSLIPLAIEFTNEIEKESIYEVLKSNEYEISYFVRGKIYFVDWIGSYFLMKDKMKLHKDNRTTICNSTIDKILLYDDESISKYIVPNSILEIGNYAFLNSNIRILEMNDNIIRIGSSAFYNSTSLEKIIFNNKLVKIESLAFKKCGKLQECYLPDSLIYIGRMCFEDCKEMRFVVIPSSVINIGEAAFNYGNIYCEVETKPKGWDENFATENAKVYWKGEWEYDENGIPYPLTKDNSNAETIS